MHEQPLTIGIETSGWSGSVALLSGAQSLGQRALDPTGRRHARTLVPEIQSLLEQAGCTPSDLDVVAVSIGPGSFTGLRVGVVCAKTLAWAANASVVAVDTYLAIATQCPADVDLVEVVGDGQRGDLYVGRYRRSDAGSWNRQGDIEIRPADEWLSQLTPDAVVAGPGLDRHEADAARRSRVLPRDCWTPRAGTVARLGRQRAIGGDLDDLWTLEPFYLRRSSAEEKAESVQQS